MTTTVHTRPLIMMVEDHQLIVEFVAAHLEKEQFDLVVAEGCSEAIEILQQSQPDLIILDAVLDDGIGYNLCRLIRNGGDDGNLLHLADVPIIMLTARANEEDRLEGFRAGADDYVTKPFNPHELVYRVRAILRRSQGVSNAQIDIGPLVVDPRRRQVRVGWQSIDLTPKEFDLLHLLACNPRRVFSREDLLKRVWDYAQTVDTRTVDVHVNRVRQKLADQHLCSDMIATKWGVGYYLDPAVSQVGT